MLHKQQIKILIKEKNLLDDFIDLETQLTPNGFDITAAKIYSFQHAGSLDFSNKERIIPETQEVLPEKKSGEKYGWWQLSAGTYKIRSNETVSLPVNLVAFAFTRTSLLRMGVFTHHGVWDAGFCGKGEFILIVANSDGVAIKQNARIAQLVFLPIEETEAYNGIFNNRS